MSKESNTGKRDAPGWFSTPHGRFVLDGTWQNEFHLRDHLGNTRRVVMEEDTGTLATLQQNHYYPFGMLIPSLSSTNTLGALKDNRYLYNGKLERSGNPDTSGEFNDDFDLNWYVYTVFIGNYGARFYDAQIGRWHSVDPLAEKYRLTHYCPFGLEKNLVTRQESGAFFFVWTRGDPLSKNLAGIQGSLLARAMAKHPR